MNGRRSPTAEMVMSGTVETAGGAADEEQLIAALRAGDEAAFSMLLDRHHESLVRLAMAYVPNRSVAEEVAQDAWIGVINGIDRFAGRSSLKTWIFRILVNRAMTRGAKERWVVPFSVMEGDTAEPAVDPGRFFPAGHEDARHWSAPPDDWGASPEDRLLSSETRAIVETAIADLPPAQRSVIALRDIEGLSAGEVCDALGISEGNQRVLLHRARAKVRSALEAYINGG